MVAIPFPDSVLDAALAADGYGPADFPFYRGRARDVLQAAFDEMIKCGMAKTANGNSRPFGEWSAETGFHERHQDWPAFIVRLDHRP